MDDGEFVRLIFGVDALVPPLTGIGRYTWELARRLDSENEFAAYFYCNDNRVSLDGRPKQNWMRRIPHAGRRWYLNRLGKRGVFHGPNYFVPEWAALSVATIHDLSVFKFPETHPIERVRQFERLFTDSINRASVLLTDSEAVRQELLVFAGCDPATVVAIPLGVSENYRPMGEKEWKQVNRYNWLGYRHYVLTVATLEPRKNIDKLLAAYQNLPLSLKRAYPLVLIGSSGWAKDDLNKALSMAITEGWLHVLGYVDERELPSLVAGAAMFIFPSKYEGFGLPVIEAMACGIPVITTDIPVLREVSLGLAKYVIPDDIQAFSQIIQHSLGNHFLLQSALNSVNTIINTYSWDRCFNRTCEVYRKLAAHL